MYPVQNTAKHQNIVPGKNAGAVSINIYNPVATAGGAVYPYSPVYSTPPTHYYPNMNVHNNPIANQSINNQLKQTPIAAKKIEPEVKPEVKQEEKVEKKEEKKAEPKKDVVPLTNEYILKLEQFLSDSNSSTRASGIKEVQKRFQEDDSRKSDPALTSLLNKALQDPSSNVRLFALSTLLGGYAKGNDLTVNLLQQMQEKAKTAKGDKSLNAATKEFLSDDAKLASEALVKISSI